MAGALPGSGVDTGAMTGAVNEIAGVSLTVHSSLPHWYNGTTTVTLACGLQVTPANHTFLKYSACACQGETLTTAIGSIVPNEYWPVTKPMETSAAQAVSISI
jgi:hypothetical protein